MSVEIVVVGSVNIDLIVQVSRLPGAGETVTGGRLTRAFGGKGANAATAAARLGARTALVAAVGADRDGRDARDDLAAAGVDHRHVVDAAAPTGVAAITVDDEGENTVAVASGANALLEAGTVTEALADLAAPGSVVLCNLEIPDAAVGAAARFCAARRLAFVLDPGPARALEPDVLGACRALTPNRGELAALGRSPRELLSAGVVSVVVTLGAHGARVHERGTPAVHVDPFVLRAVDTTGAGDAFAAGLAVALQRREETVAAAAFASAVGALATRGVGARGSLPSGHETEALRRTRFPDG